MVYLAPHLLLNITHTHISASFANFGVPVCCVIFTLLMALACIPHDIIYWSCLLNLENIVSWFMENIRLGFVCCFY
jgi:hypothetical protein